MDFHARQERIVRQLLAQAWWPPCDLGTPECCRDRASPASRNRREQLSEVAPGKIGAAHGAAEQQVAAEEAASDLEGQVARTCAPGWR